MWTAYVKRPRLVREYVYDSLYHRKFGYFFQNVELYKHEGQSALEALSSQFGSLKNEHEYRTLLQKTTRSSSAWVTPSELFHPYYGQAIAEFLVREKLESDPSQKLVVYETGPGHGTACGDVLDYLEKHHPTLYKETEYNLIEISPLLAKRQRSALAKHAERIKFHVSSAIEWSRIEERPCTFMALEVLDNLAHDRIIEYPNEERAEQTCVYYSEKDEEWHEEMQPLEDELIIKTLHLQHERSDVPATFRKEKSWFRFLEHLLGSPSIRYVPTGAYQMLENVGSKFPNANILLADFDHLPFSIKGILSPAVQKIFDGRTRSYPSYLPDPGRWDPGDCDILFPTDFSHLANMVEGLTSARTAYVMRQPDWLKQWCSSEAIAACKTTSGYNPLVQDYTNMYIYYGRTADVSSDSVQQTEGTSPAA